tara:strand:- start:16 stop:195 length:180 start_codon:yes stop_codon:yes gene_type:complete
MGNQIKEQQLTLMEKSMLGISKMINQMVKERILGKMETSMLGNGKMGNVGTTYITTKTE